ncbi:phosphotransferase family protein [Gemmobacter serpentinus]|uniref:phosphotransferase family protein n=1 Tax=Gemmobacter serpentinus TaxID=2652247 RepID=UPI00124DFA9B|nr:phosphotransferase [Gemmobacter serpentinus]
MKPDLFPSPELRQALRPLVPKDAVWQRMAGGRSNLVWRVGGLVVKQFRPDRASPLFPNDPLAERAALTGLAGCGIAPRMAGSGSDWIAYDHLPGQDWRDDPVPVARALAVLHRQPLLPSLTRAPMGHDLRRAAQVWAPQDLPPCPELNAPLPQIAPRIIHRDPVPGNIVMQDGQARLIDWQCPAIGDPAEDLAVFLSPAMQMLYRGAVLSETEIAQFLAAYPDREVIDRYRAMRGVLHWRIAAHCAWRAGQGCADYARALPLECAMAAA